MTNGLFRFRSIYFDNAVLWTVHTAGHDHPKNKTEQFSRLALSQNLCDHLKAFQLWNSESWKSWTSRFDLENGGFVIWSWALNDLRFWHKKAAQFRVGQVKHLKTPQKFGKIFRLWTFLWTLWSSRETTAENAKWLLQIVPNKNF